MEKPRKTPSKSFTLGRGAFAKISAIEGIYLDAETIADFAEFDRQGLPASERRKAIARKYGKMHG